MGILRYLGHSAFYVEGKGIKALIDPFLESPESQAVSSDFKELSHIFVTHGHGDHIGSTIEIAKRLGSVVFTCNELAGFLSSKGIKTEGMHIGGRAPFSFGTVKLTPAWHGCPVFNEEGIAMYGGVACGFVIEVDGKKIYHAGDTGLSMEMELLADENIEVAMLPIGGYYTMDIEDAVRAVKKIRPKTVIPMHYNTFPAIMADPFVFAELAESYDTKVRVLAPGEEFKF